jgi:cytochrome P450
MATATDAARPVETRIPGLFGDPEGLPDRIAAIVAGCQDGLTRVKAGPLRFAVIADPGLARALLTRPTGVRKGRGIDALKFLLGDGLLTSEAELHRRQRRLVNPAFQPSRIAGYGADFVRAAQARAGRWQDGLVLDLHAEMSSLTLEVVGHTLFGADLSGDADEIAAALESLLPTFPQLMRPWGFAMMRFPSPLRHRLRTAAGRLDAVVERLVSQRRAAIAAGTAPAEGSDLLSMLLAARDEETGDPMPPRLVRDEALTLLLAGHETTAVALSWTWFELARHPVQRDRLEAEVRGTAAAEALAVAAWERLPYTRAVIAETMRLHPPAYVIGRRVTEPVELGGHLLEPGTLCLISPYALQRDARSWPEPQAWRPERWLDASGGYDEGGTGAPRGAYLPFGAGARICIGAAFASMEATLLLATLASRFRAEVATDFEPGNLPAVTLRPKHGVVATLRAPG